MASIKPVGFAGSAYPIDALTARLPGSKGADASDSGSSWGLAPDSARISDEAMKKYHQSKTGEPDEKDPASKEGSLPPEDEEKVEHLKQRDQDVRSHEQAHITAGGSLVRGGARFEYQAGPDGKMYAVGGEVHIDTSPVDGDPRATIRKAQQIRKAALAPAGPSGQDQSVAAAAASMEMKATSDLAKSNENSCG